MGSSKSQGRSSRETGDGFHIHQPLPYLEVPSGYSPDLGPRSAGIHVMAIAFCTVANNETCVYRGARNRSPGGRGVSQSTVGYRLQTRRKPGLSCRPPSIETAT